MGGGAFSDAVERVQDRQEGKELMVHECDAVGRVLEECQSERLAKLLHQGAVDKLGPQFDGIGCQAPVPHRADTPAGPGVSLQANRIDAQAPRLCQGRQSGYAAAKVLIEAIGRCGKEPTWACTIAELEKARNVNTGVMAPISFGPGVRFSNQKLQIMQADFPTLSFKPVN